MEKERSIPYKNYIETLPALFPLCDIQEQTHTYTIYPHIYTYYSDFSFINHWRPATNEFSPAALPGYILEGEKGTEKKGMLGDWYILTEKG